MLLDFNPNGEIYFLRVGRNEAVVDDLMREYGLDFSIPSSTANEAVLFTRDPFAAAPFHAQATPAAKAQLAWIADAMAMSSALDSNRHIDLPPDQELIPFQRADVDYIMSRTHALNGDEPGLGKTPTSIAVANTMQAKRVIVICPASLRGQWLRRIADWTTMHQPFCYAVKSSRYGTSETADWTVISYELARNPAILRGLVKQRFDLLIVDEVHYAKEITAARSRAIFGYHDGRKDIDGQSVTCLMEVCERTLCLSGTPIPNRPSEAYVLCRSLAWESVDFMSEKRFRERYNPQSKGKTASGKVWTHEEEGRLPELQCRMRSFFMVRHLMVDVRHQLKAAFPDPVYDLIYLEETKAIKLALKKEKMLGLDPTGTLGADFEILGAVSTVRYEMGVAMAPQVADYIKLLLKVGETKLVIFTWHQDVTDYLRLELEPWGVVWSDGRNTGHKDFMVQQFVCNPEINVLIGNILTLGTGTDEIQHIATHCLFAESDWVPGNNMQAVSRLARIGQLSYVRAEFFVVADSMAERVLGTAIRKIGTLHKALDMNVLAA